MSNTNNTMQTQRLNALHNAIMEAGGKDHPPMLALGSSETTTEWYIENYKNVSEDIRNLLNVEAEVVHIILIGIDNDIYSIVDACLSRQCSYKHGFLKCLLWMLLNVLYEVSCITRSSKILLMF
ncbi:hypothetical protein Tco_1449352 [Tanacetum coccineum]